MKTKFPQKQRNIIKFKDLLPGDVFATFGAPSVPMIRVRSVTSTVNACSNNGEPYTFPYDADVLHYPNAVLDMGEPA